jgi:hypothetical protein
LNGEGSWFDSNHLPNEAERKQGSP